MFHLLTPHLRIESVLELTVDRLRNMGVDSVLLDLDCTLKRYSDTELRPEIADWLESLKAAGIGRCIVSNGRSERIKNFAEKIGLPYEANALKPLPMGVWRAMKKMGYKADSTAMVGDQVFADVLSGRWAGIKSILVRPIHPEEEPWFTRIKRTPESLWLDWLSRKQRSNRA
jgi:uncharacterized protein